MREIREGDRVKFLNDIGAGVVIRIIDREMVLVRTDDDGFEYPVLKNELLIEGEANRLAEEDERTKELERIEKVKKIKQAEELEKIEPVAKEKAKVKGGEKDKLRKSNIEEVDLHIKQILDDYSDMTSGEIVEVQLARFRTALEGAIKAKQKRIIFIHGKGAGKLKHDIQKIIDSEYKRCRYQDASFREYGYGATMILIN